MEGERAPNIDCSTNFKDRVGRAGYCTGDIEISAGSLKISSILIGGVVLSSGCKGGDGPHMTKHLLDERKRAQLY